MSDIDDALAALSCAVAATDFSNPMRCGECLGRGKVSDGEMDDDGWVDKKCPSCKGSGESDFASSIRQALERQRVPKGWKLVPVKPTGAIFEAWCDAGLPPSINAMAKAWRKLLAASEADDETS